MAFDASSNLSVLGNTSATYNPQAASTHQIEKFTPNGVASQLATFQTSGPDYVGGLLVSGDGLYIATVVDCGTAGA
jgi:hypothetical protein